MHFNHEITPVNKVFLHSALTLLILQGCGPSFQVIPLVGEGPEVINLLQEKEEAKATSETVVVIEHFYRAINKRQHNGMWSLLTSDTRMALDDLADALDTNGKQLLRTRMFPLDTMGDKSRRVSLASLFLVDKPIKFEAATKPGPADNSAKVVVRNAAGNSRTVTLNRERGEWKIHHTDFSKLPPAIDRTPRLLPWDKRDWTEKPLNPPEKKEQPKEKTAPKNEPSKQTQDLDF